MSDLRELYQEVILDHNKSPRNFRVMPVADRFVEGYNPLCGDHYTVYVKLNGGVIEDVSFYGSGCAISKAAASVMTTAVKGKTKEEAEKLFRDFHDLVRGTFRREKGNGDLGMLEVFSGVSEFPARVKCASLPWHALHGALESTMSPVTTE
jgi:nitrogen fixation NifU-like protein